MKRIAYQTSCDCMAEWLNESAPIKLHGRVLRSNRQQEQFVQLKKTIKFSEYPPFIGEWKNMVLSI